MSEHGKAACQNLGGECVTERDGYYTVSAFCITFAVIFLLAYIIPTGKRLQCKLCLGPWGVTTRLTLFASTADEQMACDVLLREREKASIECNCKLL